ncbi:MAG: glycine cleavage system aminomethyltransferase GcvT [Porphyromonas gingivalis]|uniref:glycine cleavage system aminomethyltransferase GcvT n=1 Tax=Porphyromonas gingivalis TaxID=837 RepID=UPI00248057FE|nr:glycine cleavage system aminomethyltransferase GcvT [Porphyromonas gingivalis]MDH7902694.1 glycine cleavage system aminomethyltransferase GcvT [Porphyromonas gingivalis]
MKTTPFTDVHIALGAKMHEFAGYNMPIEYGGIIDEHMNVVNNVGVFDVSHMGEFWVKGPNALRFLQKVSSNDASKLAVGQVQYCCFPNNDGGIVDDFLLYRYEEEKYMMVPNAANIAKDWAWCRQQNTMGAILENASDNIAQLAVQGPKATEVMQRLTDIDLNEITYYTFKVGSFAGCPDVIISATGYTGAGGFELYFYPQYAQKIWDALFEAGKPEGIKPAGLGARDTLRLEMGFCLYGNDICDTTSPIEAGLGWITKFTDDKMDMPSRKIMEEQKAGGLKRKLVAFELKDKGIPRQHYEIANAEGQIIGEVTSGTMSPCLKKGIGMGYVTTEFSKVGTELGIMVRGRQLKAEIVKPPFRK